MEYENNYKSMDGEFVSIVCRGFRREMTTSAPRSPKERKYSITQDGIRIYTNNDNPGGKTLAYNIWLSNNLNDIDQNMLVDQLELLCQDQPDSDSLAEKLSMYLEQFGFPDDFR
jgi:hypothetical protein